MARIIDLTGKLGMGERPKLKVRDQLLTVNDSARGILQVLDLTQGQMSAQDVFKALDILFEPRSRKALERLDLSLPDLVVVLEGAVDAVMGGGEDQGNPGTPATT